LLLSIDGSLLQLELRPPPVTPLGVVPNGVAGPHPEPLRDGTVLLQLLGKLLLDAERFKRRLKKQNAFDQFWSSCNNT
jgi:hypothetical protein